MKNILVPTDLSVKSLSIIHEVVKRYRKESLRIHVIHMVHIPSDISELMFFRKSNLYERVPAAFTEAMQLLQNKYQSQIQMMNLEFYFGNYAGALNMVIENSKIDEICVLDNHKYTLPLRNSVNIIPFFSKCNVPVYKMQTHKNAAVNDAHLLSSLFVDEQMNLVAQENISSAY